MRILDLKQQSREWHEWRAKRFGASDALLLAGVKPPWKDPPTLARLFAEKTGRMQRPESDYAMRRGNRLEPIARRKAEEIFGHPWEPLCVEHDEYPFLASSLDGLDDWGESLLEIKAPNLKAHTCASEGFVPDYYFPQVQYQGLITQARNLYYASISLNKEFGSEHEPHIVVLNIQPDPEYQKGLFNLALTFFDCLKKDIEPDPEYFRLPHPTEEQRAGELIFSGTFAIGKTGCAAL